MINGSKGNSSSKKTRGLIAFVSYFVLLIWGVYRLFAGGPGSPFVPVLLAVSGLIGWIGGAIGLKKINVS